MPSSREILQVLVGHPDGVAIGGMAEELKSKPTSLTKVLADLRSKEFLTHSAEGIYAIAPAGTAWLQSQSPSPSLDGRKPGQLPSEFDTFLEIGRSTGVTGELLNAIAEHVFRLNYKDPTIVFNELTSLALRADVVARWSRLWSSHLGVPAPQATTPAAPSPPALEKWTLLRDTPVRDPDGQYTFIQALQLLETRVKTGADGASAESKEMAELRLQVTKMRDELQAERISRLKDEISAQISALKTEMTSLFGQVHDGQNRSELDIISRLVDQSFAQLTGLRTDLKGVLSSGALPFPPKTPAQREAQKSQFREALTQDKVLEALEAKIWGDVPLPPWFTQMREQKEALAEKAAPQGTAAPRLLE